MEDPSYYAGPTIIDSSYSDENNNNNSDKTYVNLEVVQRNHPNLYDPAAIQLAHQSDLLFNYDSSPTNQEDQQHQQAMLHVHHHHLPIIAGPATTHHTVLHHYQSNNHEMDPSRNHHLIDLDNCGPRSYDSIRSVLLLKDLSSESQQQQQGSPQVAFLSSDPHIKTEPQMDTNGNGGTNGPPLPFWKERALQIERGTLIYTTIYGP